ncbi:hypothetical protein H2200_010322 [Cladophialophora chaetospira]|uniref:Ubiquitin-like domain-containing protein n=1 Tax=Cladophialophora chaetospira TaxID=386627 RepID=A0AA38X1B6_9EURO|nr:hypothetical protein H2200_010322 [Cladophialophora chaetospira]
MSVPNEPSKETDDYGMGASSLPDTQSKKSLIIIYQPVILSVDLTKCQTLEDLENLVRDQSESATSDIDIFRNRWGPGLLPGVSFTQADLELFHHDVSKLQFPKLHVFPEMREEYVLQVYDPRTHSPSGRHASFNVQVNCIDTVASLKKKIKNQTGISTASQRLEFNGKMLLPEDHLVTYGIMNGSSIQLTVKASLYFRISNSSIWVFAFPDTPLQDVLQSFAKQKKEDLASLLFQVFTSSGEVTQSSQQWLPERARLFNAGEVVGTVEENGFLHGDQIQVFQLNKKPSTKRNRDERSGRSEVARKTLCAVAPKSTVSQRRQ